LVAASLQRSLLRDALLLHISAGDAQFDYADLSNADLNRAYLNGASLRHGILNATALQSANLLGACLADADLSDAYLNRAYLNHANLTRTNLTGADLRSANLTGVTFADATVDNATFGGNHGLTPTQSALLEEQGAVIAGLAMQELGLSLEPLIPGDTMQSAPQPEELISDLKCRLMDTDETFNIYRETIELLRSTVDDLETFGQIHPSQCIFQTIASLEADCTLKDHDIQSYRAEVEAACLSDLDLRSLTDIADELNNTHHQIIKLKHHIQVVKGIWLNLRDLLA
jgi:uncharacterized protein YjbI with pentapeptide repeats